MSGEDDDDDLAADDLADDSDGHSDDDGGAALAPGRRLYSVAGANALVPHLTAVFTAFDEGRREMQAIVERLNALGVHVGQLVTPDRADDPRVRPHLEALSALNDRLQELVSGLGELGVEVKGLDGLVDVRSRFRGRVVYLCWRRGEPAFIHWHGLDEGFAGRVLIADPDAFEGTLLH